MAIGRQNMSSSFDQRFSVMGFTLPKPTMCEISYDPGWCSVDNSFPYRSPSTESRSSLQDYIGSLYSDATGTHFLNPSSRLEVERSLKQRRSSRHKGAILTRSFTSLGTYNGKHTSNKSGSGTVWESPRIKSRSRAQSVEAFLRESSQNGDSDVPDQNRLRWVDALNAWIPDRKPSQAFVTFVNGAPVKQRMGSAHFEGSRPFQGSRSYELYHTKLKPAPVNHTNLTRNRSAVVGQTHTNLTRKRSAVSVAAQRSEEIFVKVDKPRENVCRERRSQTAAPMAQFAQKRSVSRVRFPPSRQSRSSALSLPAAPPPSMTPSKSTESSRCGTATNTSDCPGEKLQAANFLDVTKEERLSFSIPVAGPGGDDTAELEKADSVSDVDPTVQTKSRTHSRQGSSSSTATDPSTHSKTTSASFMENVLDEPVTASQSVDSIDGATRGMTAAPNSMVLPSILIPPSPNLPSTTVLTPVTPSPVPSSPAPPSPLPSITFPVKGKEPLFGQGEITPTSPKACRRNPSPQPAGIDSQHERKQLGVRWSRDSVTDRASLPSHNEGNDSTVSMDRTGKVQDKPKLDLSPRPASPQLSTIRETETVSQPRENIQDLPEQDKKEVQRRNSHSSSTTMGSGFSRKPVQKKVRKEKKNVNRENVQSPTPTPPSISPPDDKKLSCERILEEDASVDIDQSFETVTSDPLPVVIFADIPLPTFTDVKPERKVKVKNKMTLPPTPEPPRKNQQRKASVRHSSYAEEQMQQEIAEIRRKKQQQMLESHRRRMSKQSDSLRDNFPQERNETLPRFEDYDFLAKYCIFDAGSQETYKTAFRSVDTDNPWLSREKVIKALKSMNTKLSLVEDDYLRRILELMGYNLSKGADFKLFSVIAALSKRISALDTWMKDLIGKIDFKELEMKMYLWKTLWECNVDTDSNTVSLEQLCVELRAGGVSQKHESEVRKKLGHMTTLDLLDFLTYIPLFVIIHESVIDNPLCDRREK